MNYSINGNGNNVSLTIDGLTFEQVTEILNSLLNTRKSAESKLNEVDKEILKIIRTESLLAAVKYYKDKTGEFLKEAKAHCDQLKEKFITNIA